MLGANPFGLLGQLCLLSFLAVGGVITVVPELHRVLVTDMGLLTDPQFAASIAIAQASPGPNVLFVAVMGFQAAGIPGALLFFGAILLPSTTLAFAAARWGRTRYDWLPVRAFRVGMAPIVIGLMLATGWVLAAQMPGWRPAVAAAIAALLAWRLRLHTLILILSGALAGALGWL